MGMINVKLTRDGAEAMFLTMMNDNSCTYKNGGSTFHFGKCEFYKIMDAIYGEKEMTKEEAYTILENATLEPNPGRVHSKLAKALELLKP